MRIIAIDPGYDRVGIAVMDRDEKNKEFVIFSECFQTPKEISFTHRLGMLGQHIRSKINEYKVSALVIEGLFFAKNTKTALKVSEARGVIVFQAYDYNIPVYEYTPNQIKVAVTGYGNAHKNDMYAMIKRLVTLKDQKYIDDEIDAIGVGLTFFARERF